ncbi:hypothetical protein Bca52824_000401 [Brassica carinata]|uniref:Uncharacterized protein n=1 Tax=Brassica carinata TaxID=52824 RepID=A0A8X7WFI3_BRACI|nr:hypothetical protein Bca52824_000401 [Brassica carinata]
MSSRIRFSKSFVLSTLLPTTGAYKLLAVLSAHVVGSIFSALCGEFLLSASQGKDIIVWQQPDLKIFAKFGQGDGSVKALVSVGSKVFTAHQDSKIRVWKVSQRRECFQACGYASHDVRLLREVYETD